MLHERMQSKRLLWKEMVLGVMLEDDSDPDPDLDADPIFSMTGDLCPLALMTCHSLERQQEEEQESRPRRLDSR